MMAVICTIQLLFKYLEHLALICPSIILNASGNATALVTLLKAFLSLVSFISPMLNGYVTRYRCFTVYSDNIHIRLWRCFSRAISMTFKGNTLLSNFVHSMQLLQEALLGQYFKEVGFNN